MRHLVKGNKLGRTPSHRKATLSALSRALIREHKIVTTVAKAKELRTFVEPLITKAKKDTSHNRRQVFSKLNDKAVVSHLFDEVAQKAIDRPGGYTRVVKLGYRKGDNAQTAVIELVDYNDIQPEDSKKTRRTRRAGKSKSEPNKTSESAAKAAEAEETVSDSEEAVEEDSNEKKENAQASSEEE